MPIIMQYVGGVGGRVQSALDAATGFVSRSEGSGPAYPSKLLHPSEILFSPSYQPRTAQNSIGGHCDPKGWRQLGGPGCLKASVDNDSVACEKKARCRQGDTIAPGIRKCVKGLRSFSRETSLQSTDSPRNGGPVFTNNRVNSGKLSFKMNQYRVSWPTSWNEKSEILQKRFENLKYSLLNDNENLVADRLEKEIRQKFKRQFVFGRSIFDFFSKKLGVAIEVDGRTHNEEWDTHKDAAHLEMFGIVTLRIRNQQKEDLDLLVKSLMGAGTWKSRLKHRGILLSEDTVSLMNEFERKSDKQESKLKWKLRRL